jgi:FlaA1/EpsC-like NDP-sugar epimerase
LTVEDVRPLSIDDLLGRPTVAMDIEMYEQLISGRRVLVTGAGGSIGSEISRQVFALGPKSLTLVDRDESALHALQLELEGRALLDSRHIVVADIRDRERMHNIFAEHRPDIVFHAAALKHLPLLEMFPTEAAKSNVFGTMNVLDAAGAVGVAHFVNISTDKAANPTSALGSSKRLAEGLTAWASDAYAGKFLSVRFGNVLGSRGTVLDAFAVQIAAGGPLTVTDPEVTRYFMTVSEAVQLVLYSAAIGESGEAMVLDMGEPVRIADLARQLASQAPEPVEITFTGLRPGEKLHEDLFNDGEGQIRSSHPLIFRVPVPPLDGQIVQVLSGASDADAAAAMFAIAAQHMSLDRGPGASVG